MAIAKSSPEQVFPEIAELAESEAWQAREVAATALVEIAKRHPDKVLVETTRLATHPNPNVRRAASEGLRGLVKTDPEAVRPVLEALKADPCRYVQKSVANVLRNGSTKHPAFVLELSRTWWKTGNENTRWIVRDGLRKLKISHADEVNTIVDMT